MSLLLSGRDWSLYGVRGAIVAVNSLSLLVIAAVMNLADFGHFVFLWVIAVTLGAVGSLGGQLYIMRETSALQSDPARGVSAVEAIQIVFLWPAAMLGLIAISTILAGPLFLPFVGYEAPRPTEVFLVVAVGLTLNLIGHAATPLRIDDRLTVSMLVRDGGPQLILLTAALLATLLARPHPVVIFGFFLVLSLFVLALLAMTSIKRAFSRRQLLRVSGSARALGLRSFWGTSVLGNLNAQVDILLGGLFLSNADLGAYQILKRLANLASLPQIVANWTVLVGVGRACASSDVMMVQRLCRRAATLTLLPGITLASVLLLSLPAFLWFFEIENEQGIWLVFSVILAGSVVNIICGANFTVAAQCRLEHIALRARLIGVMFAAAMILIHGAALSAINLAVAAFIALSIPNLLLWLYLRRKLSIDTSLICLLRSERHMS
ncbi:lipopolysaccharide biosynthesis protein [Thiocapsa bogorovii]|uniref:lipopolysaccharide biosynthesis protein n=1 Tax=Thiocapsa bogorovii TaxID=521689 RepID=UPI001E4304AC|nr:hypothetical protein [Thiocapsa bogorovii]UHD15466.1 hypothetical protein LT988_19690 [Thiocapsa bogorovii]